MFSRSRIFRLTKLSKSEIDAALGKLDGWQCVQCGPKQVIQKEYNFKDFHQAFDFMSRCVPFINKTDHHPEWSNVYNRVSVSLTTHDIGNSVSDQDVALAEAMEAIALKM